MESSHQQHKQHAMTVAKIAINAHHRPIAQNVILHIHFITEHALNNAQLVHIHQTGNASIVHHRAITAVHHHHHAQAAFKDINYTPTNAIMNVQMEHIKTRLVHAKHAIQIIVLSVINLVKHASFAKIHTIYMIIPAPKIVLMEHTNQLKQKHVLIVHIHAAHVKHHQNTA